MSRVFLANSTGSPFQLCQSKDDDVTFSEDIREESSRSCHDSIEGKHAQKLPMFNHYLGVRLEVIVMIVITSWFITNLFMEPTYRDEIIHLLPVVTKYQQDIPVFDVFLPTHLHKLL